MARSTAPLGPGGRPWSAPRLVLAAVGLASVVFNAVLMLSDRAPGALERVSGRIDARSGTAARVVGDVALPQSDTEIHVVVWAVAMVFVGLAAWSWRSALVGAVGVFVLSTLIELSQEPLTATRNTQIGDIVANAVGVLLGLGVVAAMSWLWGSVSSRRSAESQSDLGHSPGQEC
jgi:hypothetical protein